MLIAYHSMVCFSACCVKLAEPLNQQVDSTTYQLFAWWWSFFTLSFNAIATAILAYAYPDEYVITPHAVCDKKCMIFVFVMMRT